MIWKTPRIFTICIVLHLFGEVRWPLSDLFCALSTLMRYGSSGAIFLFNFFIIFSNEVYCSPIFYNPDLIVPLIGLTLITDRFVLITDFHLLLY